MLCRCACLSLISARGVAWRRRNKLVACSSGQSGTTAARRSRRRPCLRCDPQYARIRITRNPWYRGDLVSQGFTLLGFVCKTYSFLSCFLPEIKDSRVLTRGSESQPPAVVNTVPDAPWSKGWGAVEQPPSRDAPAGAGWGAAAALAQHGSAPMGGGGRQGAGASWSASGGEYQGNFTQACSGFDGRDNPMPVTCVHMRIQIYA